MRLHFTIRDLLWLTALVAMGLGWWLHDRSMVAERNAITKILTTWKQTSDQSYQAVNERLHAQIEDLEKQLPVANEVSVPQAATSR